MEIAVRQSSREERRNVQGTRRGPQCRTEALVMRRRHVSPPRWGAPLVTEYYDCEYCDASYQFSPADNRWRPVAH